MSRITSLISEATEKAERGLSEARYLDQSSPTFDYALFQAWDQLQTAATLLDAARHEYQMHAASKSSGAAPDD